MAGINFIASVAFFNILPAMILARTSNNEKILGLVSGAIGVGGIVGGLLVIVFSPTKSKVKTIFVSSALSFLLCDMLLGIGRTPFIWIFGAFAGNLPIPFLNAAENYLLMSKIPKSIQGRIFSIRGTLQFITVPIGYLVGGGNGSGMALMFIITGISGFVFSVILCNNTYIRELESNKM